MCLEAVAVSTKRPVDSTTTSTPRSFHCRLPGILDGQDLDLAAVDEDGAVLGGDLGLEVAVDGIVLQQMREALGVGEIVDADHLDVTGGFQRRPEKDASDAPETVDADSNAHGRAPCGLTDRLIPAEFLRLPQSIRLLRGPGQL
jgi:hypothetical protein